MAHRIINETILHGVNMSNPYAPIEQLRGKNEFLRVEMTEHRDNGETVEGIDPKIGKGYVTKTAVICGIGMATPVLGHFGISPIAVLSAQTLLAGLMIGQLSGRALNNSRLNALETSYIQNNGTEEENAKLQDHLNDTKNYKPLKRVFLGASALLAGSMTVMEVANSGQSTLASNIISVAAGVSLTAAAVMHFYDKLAMGDRDVWPTPLLSVGVKPRCPLQAHRRLKATFKSLSKVPLIHRLTHIFATVVVFCGWRLGFRINVVTLGSSHL